jgi:micrococcal nuclease
MKTVIIKASIIFSLFVVNIPVLAQSMLPTVVSVGDGDTLRLRTQRKTITVRLGCIDSPELAQKPWGEQARNRLRQFLPAGAAVLVREIDRDRYGRTVAELYLGNTSVNLQMVRVGQAVVYRQYLSGCAATKDKYLQAEAEARQKRNGFCHQPSPVMHWDFRHTKSTSVHHQTHSSPTSSPTPQASSLPACVNSDCNCSDFETQAQAQRVLDALPHDPFDIDRDHDGLGTWIK